ncbi:MAG: hypothetical protein HC767_01305 [Akkermansiaceae bacterium]|nr:hypothetical protein [Akkermansiaceae bacterium]
MNTPSPPRVTRSMTERLRKLDGIFVEANYDEELLGNDTKTSLVDQATNQLAAWPFIQRPSNRSDQRHLSPELAARCVRPS